MVSVLCVDDERDMPELAKIVIEKSPHIHADTDTKSRFDVSANRTALLLSKTMAQESRLPGREKIFERGSGNHTGPGLFLAQEILAITGIRSGKTGIPGNRAGFEIRVPKESVRSRTG